MARCDTKTRWPWPRVIAPVRPTLKPRYPLSPIEEFARWTRPDGAPLDPWLRTHWRLGARIIATAPRSQTMTGTVAEWQAWTGMAFPATRPRPGHNPVRFGQGERMTVQLSHLDKVFFPDDGLTKGDLVSYYREMAPAILGYLRDRPLTLDRYPDGITGPRIVQKNAGKHFPDWVRTTEVPKQGGAVCHVLADRPDTLVHLANQAAIELHVFLSRVGALDQPDQLVFDLDPPSGDRFGDVCRHALHLRAVLEDELSLTSYGALHRAGPAGRDGGDAAAVGRGRRPRPEPAAVHHRHDRRPAGSLGRSLADHGQAPARPRRRPSPPGSPRAVATVRR